MFGQAFQGKTEDPLHHRFLERPRVDRILEKALQSHVVTVMAGEGSGKTYAVSSFLQKNRRKFIWVQLSKQDNLGWHSWENYTQGVARLNPRAAKILFDMGFPESDRQFDRYLSLLKDEIISPEPYVLVFDDSHLVTNPVVLRHIDRSLTAPVSKNTVVIISRTEPTISTVNLLAKGLLAEITAEDLRFTMEEMDAYFRLHNVLLEEGELTRIFDETEGWPLALGLILHEIRAADSGGHSWDRVMRPIKKMEENIFSSMEGGLQKFLVKLSLIEHWPRNLLERFDPDGKNIAAMETFSSVIRSDVYFQGFRIHHLFLDFLKEKQASLLPEEIRDIYRKDAQWCMENGLPTNAAMDYERVRDYGGLIRLIESLPRLLSRTVASFFLDIVERLGSESSSEFSAGEYRDFLFLRFVIRSRLLASLDRFEESAEECRAVITRFESLAPDPSRSRILAAAYNNLGALGIRACRYTRNYDFAAWFEKGFRYYLENPEPARGQIGQSNIGSYAIQVGISAAPEEVRTFIDSCAASSSYTSVSLSGYLYGTDTLARSELAYYRGDFNRAEQFARQAVFQGREKNQNEVETCALFYLMRLNIPKNDIAGIREAEQQLKAQMEKSEYINRYNIFDTIMGRFYIRLGLVEKVAPWLRMERGEGDLNVLSRGFDTLIKARCLFIEKNFQEALQILEAEQNSGDLESFLLGFLEMAVLEAVILHQNGDRKGATAALKKAYDTGQPHGLVMPFIELGDYMHSFLSALLKDHPDDPANTEIAGIPRKWLQTIRRDASAYAKKRALVAAQYSGRETPAPPDFSQYELSIVQNLSRGLTSEKIALALQVPVKTVKSAIRRLYSKLGAANRAGAVRSATEKGLLPGTAAKPKKLP
ncbi:MAG: LuxR C-terminal-related transcriptional regulator [Spirochaetaceae bacterium]|jgi:LuxR family maltose regulon positive regulatory protein|nr:LuxR C-terminal-related transcriptional regulator [Spirochaetaceae bacterium]